MIINRGSLRDLQVGYKQSFQSVFESTTALYQAVSTIVPSGTSSERYPWLGSIPGVREWVGERVLRNISEYGYEIRNRSWEQTVTVPRPAIEDDQFGVYAPLMEEMGRAAKTHPDTLVFNLLRAGFSTLCFDGQFYFDTDHPVLDLAGNAYSVSNMQAGAGAPWYLMDLRRRLKPIIFQERKRPEFVAKDDPDTSDEVFMRNEFVYGSYARHNVGFGFWQLAFGSKAPLTKENFRAARNAMMQIRRDYGDPLGVVPTHIVVGPSTQDAARDLILSERLTNGESNTDRNLVTIMEVPWLD